MDNSIIVGTAGLVRYTPGKKMGRKDFSYYYDGIKISDEAYEEMLKTVCPRAYSTLETAEMLGVFEWLLGGVGFTLLDVGIWAAIEYGDEVASPWFTWGWVSLGAAIPCMIGKYSLRNKSVRVFNEQCANPSYAQSGVELQFGVSPTSVGLTLKF